MRCQFLREAQVKFCRASAYRKMIVRLAENTENERCSSGDYINCPAAKMHHEENPSSSHCPFLHESLVQYCTAAAVTKYIPYTESLLSQCGTDSHKYCELHLALAQPQEPSEHDQSANATGPSSVFNIDDVKVPKGLSYSPNHMWIDIGNDGVCHIGIDAFLARVLGSIDQITFVTVKGVQRPSVSFSVNDVDLQFIFPIPMNIIRANTYLRSHPEKIIADPYSSGWLFEVSDERFKERRTEIDGLISGTKAPEWMTLEMERMNQVAHRFSAQPDAHGVISMADGGYFRPGIARRLSRADVLTMYNDFFSPITLWKQHP